MLIHYICNYVILLVSVLAYKTARVAKSMKHTVFRSIPSRVPGVSQYAINVSEMNG